MLTVKKINKNGVLIPANWVPEKRKKRTDMGGSQNFK
jgi:hypothetical protein